MFLDQCQRLSTLNIFTQTKPCTNMEYIFTCALKIQPKKRKKNGKIGNNLDNTQSVLIYLQKVSKVNP